MVPSAALTYNGTDGTVEEREKTLGTGMEFQAHVMKE